MTDKPKKPSEHRRWIACPTEEEYFGDRKASRKERRRLTEKDRSKYKKTDQKKLEKHAATQKENLLRGRVLSVISEGIIVDTDGTIILCTLRGLLKKEKSLQKNLVIVGDFVLYEKISDEEGAIEHVEPRNSTLSRADTLSHKKEHLIAANIDQVLITGSVVDPMLKPPLIDRYIIAARKGNMDPVIVINKIDLLKQDPKEKELLNACIEAYASANIPILQLSVETGEGLDELRAVMKDKASVFSGQSGVGKSSLINSITGLDLEVGETVKRTRKGAHTTTSAHLVRLEFGGWCIDTPGIRSFGVWNLVADEVQHYFAEILELSSDCKYPNCSHIHEPDCVVREAVEKGEISKLRYESYHSLMKTVDEEHKRR